VTIQETYLNTSTYIKWLFLFYVFALLYITPLHAESIASTKKDAVIVVSIKPLYSLVSHLTQGIETPVLLMKQAQSPHHYSIRPSERRLLANAKMIIWLGPELELSLEKIIKQTPATAISALQADELQLLPTRNSHDTKHHTHHNSHFDPHIWLSAHNAAAISRYINKQLIKNDPENTEQYQENLRHLLIKIKQTNAFVTSKLQSSEQSFVAYHDAFQYFEDENSLNFAGAISTDEETSTSLKHLHEIKQQIKQQDIHCLVYQPPKPAIAETLARQHNLNTTMLDILGVTTKSDENAWFEIMESLAIKFNQCLTKK